MIAQAQTNPPADDTPYSFETFFWLMKNYDARGLFSDEDWLEIEGAVGQKNEAYLKTIYPIVLERFAKERDININFALQQESLMNDFTSHVEEVDHQVKAEQKTRNDQSEAAEHTHAEDVLVELNQ